MTERRTAGPAGGDREVRLGAALRANIAKRKARAHAARQSQTPPHEVDEAPGASKAGRRADPDAPGGEG